MSKNICHCEEKNTDTVTIGRTEYRDLVAIRSRVEAMVDFAMNAKYTTVDEMLLILGVKREKEEDITTTV